MVICFAGMITLTLSSANSASGGDEIVTDPAAEEEIESTSSQLVLGYSLVFFCSWVYSSNCVLNRSLSHVHHAIVMFYHGVGGLILAVLAISIEAAVVGGPMRFFHYDANVYLLMVGAVLLDSMAVNAVTIAFQSSSSGFVALVGYTNILYAFLADLIIFKETFGWLEFTAAGIILCVTVGTSVYKIREGNRRKLEQQDEFKNADSEAKESYSALINDDHEK